ncbi:hypothetical protein CPLU01_11697 [Colletotrichum plurivorum]|uniref:Uncharacterized protein n=1 Tax=Colletotrichum plurivorum TaxID=2175906 RepID=A0A8H6K105_9PEZI|nr:hypothetical protein CPLU01_11697 [Colletotrichum plurivorum]
MVSAALLSVLMATAASAAPYITERNLNSTKWTPSHKLASDEVILFGNGRMEVVHESTWKALLAQQNISPETPKLDLSWLDDVANLAETVPELHERQSCGNTFSVVTDKEERFVDWDVQMAPVVIGQGSKGIDVSVASSYSVSNSVSASAGVDVNAIKERLGVSLGIDYSRTWTTQATVTVRGTIDDGWTGTVITKPWKNRRYGRTFQGCPGSLKQTGTWIADSHEEGSYEGVKWVAGAITVCAKKQSSIPLSRCNGDGNFK